MLSQVTRVQETKKAELTGHFGDNLSLDDKGVGKPVFKLAASLEGKKREKRIPIAREKSLLLNTRSEEDVKCCSSGPVAFCPMTELPSFNAIRRMIGQEVRVYWIDKDI